MYTILTVLIIILCILLILIVLVQNPKGGGLNQSFGISNQIMGVKRTTDFLEKATWTLAIGLLAFSLVTGFFVPRKSAETTAKSDIEEQMENMPSQPPPAMPPVEQNNPQNNNQNQ